MAKPVIYNFDNILEVQQQLAPKTYENIDFAKTPERFRTELGSNSKLQKNARVKAMLADPERVKRFRQLTLMGDPVADACATLFPKMGFAKARALLDQALEEGIDAIPDAPEELKVFMATIEHVPDWVDFDKIEQATRRVRPFSAVFDQLITRASFMITYVNGYQGLPMLVTGALAGDAASRRIRETTSTLRLSMLPGAMKRDGEAFKSAAKVRIMHAMVRYNLLHNSKLWDPAVYGVPIPQVDQMGAALTAVYLMAKRALKAKRGFTRTESGIVDLSRYMAYLLGMHHQFLSDDPQEIVDTWQMVQATLPHKFDPRGLALNEATLNAYLRRADTPMERTIDTLDRHASKVVYQFLVGKKTAEQMQAAPGPLDWLAALTLGLPLASKYASMQVLRKMPGMADKVDRYAINTIRNQLQLNVNPVAYKTDVENYNKAL
jgi:hypothetical protein